MGVEKKREEEEVWQTPGSGPVRYYPPSSSAFQNRRTMTVAYPKWRPGDSPPTIN